LPPSALSRLLDEANDGNAIFRREDLGMARPTGVSDVDFVPTSKGGGQLLDRRPPASKPNDEGHIELPDAEDPVYGPRIRIPVSVAREKYPHLLKRLEAGAAAGSASAESQPVALPKDAKELKIGTVYNTARGPAKWDGKKFLKLQ